MRQWQPRSLGRQPQQRGLLLCSSGGCCSAAGEGNRAANTGATVCSKLSGRKGGMRTQTALKGII